VIWFIHQLDAGWDNVISSAEAFSGCNHFEHWTLPNEQGAVKVCMPTCAFAEGQPLYCSGLDDMTLAEADRYLREWGFTVYWQIERGAATTVETAPPATGIIAAGVAFDAHTVQIVVVPAGSPEWHVAPSCP